ncbi:MAG: DNA polymerase III subunit alpha [Spirochaetales bacterium]|nr:DNA polymerase III subunit alpha [Spirochaetales bacterium]
MPEFVHLHTHSDYSLLDGASSIKKMVAKAQALGMKHVGLTDHGNMFGALRFYEACRAAGINPVIGCELYVSPGSRFIKSGAETGNKYYHLVLLAKSERGYKNLIELCSAGYTEGFYYKPRVDDELLAQFSEDLIASSACIAGEIPALIISGKPEKAEEKALFYRDLFGEGNFYLELQDHGIKEQKIANKGIIEISKKTGIPLIATNDSHYIDKQDANAQDILLCIGTGRHKNDEKRMRFSGDEFYFKSQEEMALIFPEIPEAISNTVRLAEKCNIEIKYPGPLLPVYDIPPPYTGPGDYLRGLTYEGLEERYPGFGEDIRERADFELDIIISMDFPSYFLIVWDFIHWARQHDIPVGPGRGSGAGSIVAYALKITDIDPLKYNLLFERFLNPERVSMPDFDIDFCYERRQEVINYVTEKYGKEKVGQIITFGTLKTKAVLKDVARVLEIPFSESDTISKLVPVEAKMTVDKAIEMEPDLKQFAERGGAFNELFDTARRLEGLSRHASTHAAGIVIGKTKLTDYVPLYRDKTGAISTQYTMEQLEPCGLVKMDFLGLKTLTLIRNTEKLIRKKFADFSIENIPEDDEKTFKMLGEGKSTCIFQFESSGMQGILKQAKPGSIEDLIALNALYRPGPMQYIPQFIDSKSGKMAIKYPDPSLEEVLKPTYGVIVYQEQVMTVAQIIGGFSLGKADILRRAMGKKKVKEMEKMKIEFIEGAVTQGFDKKHADEIFELLVPFAGYGFNKSHAAAYSVLAYQTAYLKANFPPEFMAANLTNEINSPDKLAEYISEAQEMGIEMLPPNMNLSEKTFTVVDEKIVYGLIGIKNVGEAAVIEILEKRDKDGEFTSFIDFAERVDLKTVNRKVIETSIQTGLFDSLGLNRASLIHNLEKILEFVGQTKADQGVGQVSLFEAPEHQEFHSIELEQIEEWPQKELLKFEKDFLGFYFSGHPMDKYRKLWEKATNIDLSNPDRSTNKKKYQLIGMIKSVRSLITKKGDKMAFAILEDYRGSIEAVIFPKTYAEIDSMINVDEVLGFEGKFDNSRGKPSLQLERIVKPEEFENNTIKEFHIRLNGKTGNEEELYELRNTLQHHSGESPVFFHLQKHDREIIIKASNQILVDPNNLLFETIKSKPEVSDAWKE